ncbi:rhodanese-like domain-containing protein [Ekhidna sp.]|uniref:rhodanese-like domain-containing protein n=1 Tax=Ekhidna sp. TaxID=2608089 RepID=UPI003C7DE74E
MAYQNISPEKFKSLIGSEDHVLLDVRTPAEYVEGKIEGHQLINFNTPDFPEQIDKLDRSKNYLVYCRSGNRSGQTCQLMQSMGFSGNLYNLEGGIHAWNDAYGNS